MEGLEVFEGRLLQALDEGCWEVDCALGVAVPEEVPHVADAKGEHVEAGELVGGEDGWFFGCGS